MTATRFFYLLTAAALCAALTASAQNNYEKTVTDGYSVNVFKPGKVDATDARVAQLKAPAGFTVTKFAENVGKPRMLVVAPNGDVYISDCDKGTVLLVRDANKDGKAEAPRQVAQHPDGSLLITDDANGVIYRVAYTGTGAAGKGKTRKG